MISLQTAAKISRKETRSRLTRVMNLGLWHWHINYLISMQT